MMRHAAPEGMSPAWALHAAMAAVVLSAALAVLPAADRESAAEHAWTLALGGAAYGAACAAGRFSAARTVVITALVGAAAAVSLYYVAQYRYLAPLEAKVSAVDALGRALSGSLRRVGSWAPFANSLGTLLEGMVAVAAGLALARGPALLRAVAAAAAVLILLACTLTASRGTWMAVAVSLALVAAHRHLLRWNLALAGAVLAVLLAVVASAVDAGTPWWIRWAGAAGRPDRVEVYAHAVSLLRDVPFTGLGGGEQFAAAVSKYVLLIQVPFITYAHSLLLQVWLAYGVLGLAAWCALGGAVIVAAVAGERARLGRRFRGLWAGVLAVHVHGLSDARQFVDGWTWAPFFLLTGVVAGYVSRPECRLPRGAVLAPLGVAAAVVAAVLVGRGDPLAAWATNRGALAQARADAAAPSGVEARAQRAAADAFFAQALMLNPDEGPALRRRGQLALDEGRHADAVRLLARAWAVEPDHPATRKAYGLAAVWAGDTALAARVLAPVPGIADELTTWSRWRHERGERALAVAAARASLAVAPDQPQVAAWLDGLEAELRDADAPPRR